MSKVFIADKNTLDKVHEIVAADKTKINKIYEMIEVDTDVIKKIYDIVSADAVYGFIEHCAILAPDKRIEYIGKNANYEPISVTMGGGYSLGSWVNFSVLANNKPWMVKSDGTPDYELNENDYMKKAADGKPSDVANTSYNGGAFSWICKIYKKEYMIGDDRYVLFSETKKEGFEPIGFIDSDNNELEGVWLPMFYNTDGVTKATCIATGMPEGASGVDSQKRAIDAFGIRAKFFGGTIINTIIDLLIMWAKTTALQDVYGKGNSLGYTSNQSQHFGVRANLVVDGGQFYGSSTGKELNKILHSIVLGTYQVWIVDPYLICKKGELRVSKNYSYYSNEEAYDKTGIFYNNVDPSRYHYCHKHQIIPGYGAVPSPPPYKGSAITGACAYFRANFKFEMRINALRCGRWNNEMGAGVRFLDMTKSHSNYLVSSAILLLPPVGVIV